MPAVSRVQAVKALLEQPALLLVAPPLNPR